MKVLFVVPEIRLDSKPLHIPFWAGILAAIVEQKGGQVAILDLNALRTKYGGTQVPLQLIAKEVSSEKWDLIGTGGLTTTYGRIKQLAPLIRKYAPDSLFIGGGGWSSYNPTEILELIPELDLLVIGEGEETFGELYDKVNNGSKDFESVNGLCLRDTTLGFKFANPRALLADLNTIPHPAYDLLESEIYFKYSALPFSIDSFQS